MKIINGILTFESENEFIKNTYNKNNNVKYYVFDKIKTALLLNLEHVYLFKINVKSSAIAIKVGKNEWASVLVKCVDYFESKEEYLKCQECLSMIKKISK